VFCGIVVGALAPSERRQDEASDRKIHRQMMMSEVLDSVSCSND
jgi:hypothetical protein